MLLDLEEQFFNHVAEDGEQREAIKQRGKMEELKSSSPVKGEESPEKEAATSLAAGEYTVTGKYTKDAESKELKMTFKVEQGGIITF